MPDANAPGEEGGAAIIARRNAPSLRRSCTKLVRYTETELMRVNERARASGRPVACYIREVSLAGRAKGGQSPFSDRVVRDLARVGTRLRALARRAVEENLPDAADFESALGDLLTLIRDIN